MRMSGMLGIIAMFSIYGDKVEQHGFAPKLYPKHCMEGICTYIQAISWLNFDDYTSTMEYLGTTLLEMTTLF